MFVAVRSVRCVAAANACAQTFTLHAAKRTRMSKSEGRVLIVDDNLEFQSLLADLAVLGNCAVSCARTLREARRLARGSNFDLAILDLDLPDGNGMEIGRAACRERGGCAGAE